MKQLLFFLFILGALSAYAQEPPPPCACCAPENQQFDFWVGDWEAHTTSEGKLAGTNKILKLQDQCIVQENWVSASGNYTGTSYNFYNADTKKWQQLWIDNQGGNLQLEGERVGDQMILSSKEFPGKEGNIVQHRITWTAKKDGTVRQEWDLTKDGGKTWASLFDGIYSLKEKD